MILLLFFLLVILYLLIRPVLRGAIYFPTPKEVVKTVVEVAKIKNGEKVVDAGSGDGRIVIALAESGAVALGLEINPLLVWYSRLKIKRAGLGKNASIYWQSFWRTDFSPFDVVVVFGLPNFLEKFSEKLKKELKPEARILTIVSPLPFMTPRRVEEVGRWSVYLYQR